MTDKRRTPAHDVPEAVEEHDFTPVMGVIERAIDLTDRERKLLQIVWQHTANIEMRSRARHDTGDTAALEKRIDRVDTAIVDIRGERGDNGKLGALKARVDQSDARRWQVQMFLAGLLVTVISAAVAIGVWKGRIDSDIEALKARVQRARSIDINKDTSP